MKEGLKELVELSHYYGQMNDYVIAGGGNTSYKNETTLWVKGSGTRLGDIPLEGFVELDRKKLDAIAKGDFSEDADAREQEVKEALLDARLSPEKNQRPSVESSLHELLEGKFVVHTHPSLVNALLCSENAEAKSKELFGDGMLYIPYIDPGYILFKRIQTDVDTHKEKFGKAPDFILLENHGIFVDADTVEGIKEKYEIVMGTINKSLTRTLKSDPVDSDAGLVDTVLPQLKEKLSLEATFRTNSFIMQYCESQEVAEKVGCAFTPDIIVYCKSRPLFAKLADSAGQTASDILQGVADYEAKFGYQPKIILLEKTGMIALETNEKSLITVLDVFEDAMKISYFSEDFGGPHFMSDDERAFIENWEVESYRQQMAKS